MVHRRHRRRARDELPGAADRPGRRRGLGARPHAAAPSRAVQRGDARLPGADPARPRSRRLGPHRLRLRGRRGGRGLRCRSVPRPRRQPRHPRPARPGRGGGGGGRCGGSSLRASERFCLAIGTAEPRKDLPGLVRAFGAVAGRQADVALVLAGPPGWGEQALASAVAASRWREQDRPYRLGASRLDLAALALARQRAGLPLPLRGVRVPAAAGHARRGARGRDPGGLVARGARRRRPAGRRRAITTAWSRRSAPAWATRRSAAASLPRARRGRRAIHGSVAAPGSRRSIATRRPAVAEQSAPTVLLAVEQLRRRVPGGIGAYARGLLGGLAVCRDGGRRGRGGAPGQPGARRRGRSAGRVRAAAAHVAAAGPAPDPGLGPRAVPRSRRVSTSCTRCRWPRPGSGAPARDGWS